MLINGVGTLRRSWLSSLTCFNINCALRIRSVLQYEYEIEPPKSPSTWVICAKFGEFGRVLNSYKVDLICPLHLRPIGGVGLIFIANPWGQWLLCLFENVEHAKGSHIKWRPDIISARCSRLVSWELLRWIRHCNLRVGKGCQRAINWFSGISGFKFECSRKAVISNTLLFCFHEINVDYTFDRGLYSQFFHSFHGKSLSNWYFLSSLSFFCIHRFALFYSPNGIHNSLWHSLWNQLLFMLFFLPELSHTFKHVFHFFLCSASAYCKLITSSFILHVLDTPSISLLIHRLNQLMPMQSAQLQFQQHASNSVEWQARRWDGRGLAGLHIS